MWQDAWVLFWGLTWWLNRDSYSGHLRVSELKRDRGIHSSLLAEGRGQGGNFPSTVGDWWCLCLTILSLPSMQRAPPSSRFGPSLRILGIFNATVGFPVTQSWALISPCPFLVELRPGYDEKEWQRKLLSPLREVGIWLVPGRNALDVGKSRGVQVCNRGFPWLFLFRLLRPFRA